MEDLQQKAAIETESKHALIIATAGSGKTRCLIERIAYLVEKKKVSPSEIMSFSFSRKASQEIRERLIARIGSQAHGCILGTMHSISLQMIQRFGETIGLKSRPVTVYNQWENDYLLRDVAQEMGLHDGKKWKKLSKGDVEAVFAEYSQKGIEPAADNPAHDIFQAFQQRCRQNQSFPYDGLLAGLKLLIPVMAKYLNVKHILTDENQDFTPLQWVIINEMVTAFGASLFTVGDDDQSIYSFRGAVPEYLVGHQSEFEIYRLESNYRSVPSIVEASNRLISHNVERIPKTMVATREGLIPGSAVSIMKEMDSERIGDFFEKEVFTCPVAILGRNHFLLEKLSRLLDEKGVAHEYIGRTTALTNSEHFRRYHAFLKLAINPYDNFSFLLIKDIIGLSRDQYSEIRIGAAREGKSHFQVYCEPNNPFWIGDPAAFGDSLKYACHHLSRIFPELSPEAGAFASKWEQSHAGGIKEYLNWLALIEVQDELKDEPKGITLMTIHAAKGLEWPVVILAGCNEGILPSRKAIENLEEEDERRLMYVAMTRARDQLIITVRPEHVEKDGKVYDSPISRFVGEAGLYSFDDLPF